MNHRTDTHSPHGQLSTPDAKERLRALRYVLLPAVAGGVILRRPAGMAMAARRDWDGKGVRVAREMRERYGPGPLMLLERGRPAALVLDPADSERLLASTPEPFSAAPREKRGALGQFQPHGVLISEGSERRARRQVNEDVLDTGRPVHRSADRMVRIVREEVGHLLADHTAGTALTWDDFSAAWWRAVRRITLGDVARDDTVITSQLDSLRAAGNWSVLSPRRVLLRAAFSRRLNAYAAAAESDALIAQARSRGAADGSDPVDQVPHWLFAFDAAGMTVWRTLALLATHPAQAAEAQREIRASREEELPLLPFLRACATEAVRLWPTTPLILRESTEDTEWHGRTVPAGTLFVIYAPYLHRSDTAGPDKDRFAPESWLDGSARANTALVPFSAGPAGCPGEDLVLLTASSWLAAALDGRTWSLTHRTPQVELGPDQPLPAGLNPFGLGFAVRPGEAA
ncbi:cytochrome P450, partial [Streptomyces sparsus]